MLINQPIRKDLIMMTLAEQHFMETVSYNTDNIASSLNLQNTISALTLAYNSSLISKDALAKELTNIFKKLNIEINL